MSQSAGSGLAASTGISSRRITRWSFSSLARAGWRASSVEPGKDHPLSSCEGARVPRETRRHAFRASRLAMGAPVRDPKNFVQVRIHFEHLGTRAPARGRDENPWGVWNSPDNASSALSNRAQEGTAMIVSTKRPLKDTEYRIQELELTKDGGLRLETLSTQYAHPITITLDSEEADRIETKLYRAEKGSRVKVEDS